VQGFQSTVGISTNGLGKTSAFLEEDRHVAFTPCIYCYYITAGRRLASEPVVPACQHSRGSIVPRKLGFGQRDNGSPTSATLRSSPSPTPPTATAYSHSNLYFYAFKHTYRHGNYHPKHNWGHGRSK
jgi:hypothetical protein